MHRKYEKHLRRYRVHVRQSELRHRLHSDDTPTSFVLAAAFAAWYWASQPLAFLYVPTDLRQDSEYRHQMLPRPTIQLTKSQLYQVAAQ